MIRKSQSLAIVAPPMRVTPRVQAATSAAPAGTTGTRAVPQRFPKSPQHVNTQKTHTRTVLFLTFLAVCLLLMPCLSFRGDDLGAFSTGVLSPSRPELLASFAPFPRLRRRRLARMALLHSRQQRRVELPLFVRAQLAHLSRTH